jgi:hypothetical protein
VVASLQAFLFFLCLSFGRQKHIKKLKGLSLDLNQTNLVVHIFEKDSTPLPLVILC